MTIQELGSIGEFVAAIATIATLVYLALQLRNNTRVGRFDAHLKTRQLTAEAHRILTDRDNARIWRVGLGDPDALTEDERINFHSILYLILNSIDARLEYRRATRDPNAYDPQGDIVSDLAGQPGFQRWWKIAAKNYNAEMNARVERGMEGGGADRGPLY